MNLVALAEQGVRLVGVALAFALDLHTTPFKKGKRDCVSELLGWHIWWQAVDLLHLHGCLTKLPPIPLDISMGDSEQGRHSV